MRTFWLHQNSMDRHWFDWVKIPSEQSNAICEWFITNFLGLKPFFSTQDLPLGSGFAKFQGHCREGSTRVHVQHGWKQWAFWHSHFRSNMDPVAGLCGGGSPASPAPAVLCAQSTLEACRDLNGRLFGGRLIHCCLYDNNRYFARMLDANKLLDPSRGLPQGGVGGPGIIFKAKSFKKF